MTEIRCEWDVSEGISRQNEKFLVWSKWIENDGVQGRGRTGASFRANGC